jgi:hypothetical protein
MSNEKTKETMSNEKTTEQLTAEFYARGGCKVICPPAATPKRGPLQPAYFGGMDTWCADYAPAVVVSLGTGCSWLRGRRGQS